MWTVDARKKKKEKSGYFQQHEKYRYHIATLAFYTSVMVLGVLKEDLGSFFNSIGSFKDGFWRTFY